MTVRTRFAPSPTGYLHIGGARTALYCWLFAKKHRGQFILRIEDTDTERSTQASCEAILEGMAWLGLDYNEGPFYQSDRFDRYREIAETLVQQNKAYRCYCAKERLEVLRATQLEKKLKPRYDGHCRQLSGAPKDKPHVIRFKNPDIGSVTFKDLIHERITVQNEELDDFVMIRSDGIPTYNFSVVIDDIDMKITHVIRGDDHINNTPRQINLIQALNEAAPIYAHVPMILGADGKRLSKRHGAVSVLQYQEEGYLPEALLNYLVRLGWSHGNQEIFSKEEMIDLFDIANVHKAPAALNPEKLIWLNQHYLKTLSKDALLPQLDWHLQREGISPKSKPTPLQLLEGQRERVKTLKELVDKSLIFYQEKVQYNKEATEKFLTPEVLPIFKSLLAAFEELADWQKEGLHEVISQVSLAQQVKLGQVAQPLRVALTGNTISPAIDITLELMGKEKTQQRLLHIINLLDSGLAIYLE